VTTGNINNTYRHWVIILSSVFQASIEQ